MLVHGVPLLAFWLARAMVVFSRLDRLQNPKPYYSEFPNSLKVLESRMNWAETREGLRIILAGVLTNDSPVAWGSTEFDCRFFDTNGVMVDASTGRGKLTINPYDDAAFRVSVAPTAPTNDYASFKISVGHARNVRGWF